MQLYLEYHCFPDLHSGTNWSINSFERASLIGVGLQVFFFFLNFIFYFGEWAIITLIAIIAVLCWRGTWTPMFCVILVSLFWFHHANMKPYPFWTVSEKVTFSWSSPSIITVVCCSDSYLCIVWAHQTPFWDCI